MQRAAAAAGLLFLALGLTAAFAEMLRGGNFGKMPVRIGEDPMSG